MQRLIFEHSPYYFVLCIALGLGYAWLLYTSNHTWSKRTNQLLFAIRTVVVSFLSFLLLGPIIKLISNEYEKPSLVFLMDNSKSIEVAMDSLKRNQLLSTLQDVRGEIEQADYEVVWKDLNGETIDQYKTDIATSDINKGIQSIINEYEGKNLTGIVLVSDGIYNSGSSPLYSPVRVPVYSIGVGDSTEHVDLILKNVVYNKVAYQGNKFPLKAQVVIQGIQQQEVTVNVAKDGKVLSTQLKNSANHSLLEFDFLLDATEKGIQRYDVSIKSIANESNLRNNGMSIFIDVIDGRKKIVLIAPAPHPDIKAFRSVVEKNSNYEFIVHIPGVEETNAENLKPGVAELVIFHEVLDVVGKTMPLYNSISKSNSSMLVVVGSQSNLRQLSANEIPVQFEGRGQWDEVTPVINNEFRDFNFLENSDGIFSRYPPVQVPFGKVNYPADAKVLLYQRIGSVVTNRPFMLSWEKNNRKVGVIIAEGLWRLRLGEFADQNNTEAFDDMLSKFIQYLSTQEDKRKFRCFPLQNEFTDGEAAVIESQVYNELFELVYGNTIDVQLRDEQGKVTTYSYTTGPGSSRYRIGGLKEGVYRFKAATTIENNKEEVSGQFLVKAQNIEEQNLTADFGLLRKLSNETGGKFYLPEQLNVLSQSIQNKKAVSLIHSEESFNQLINLKWIFFLLLSLISLEWFLRKYLGSY